MSAAVPSEARGRLAVAGQPGLRRRRPTALASGGLIALLALPALGQIGNVFEPPPPAPGVPDALGGEAAEPWQDAPAELDVFLPGDRGRERLLDRARRLATDERWSDAAAACDELLALDRDAFVAGGAATTRGSIRSEAAALVEQLPRPGRDAYERLFNGRASKQLAAAIAADDAAAIAAVARRWQHTQAGRQAAIISAVKALEAGQPLAASAWLDRLASSPAAADLEPTLSVMRAAALGGTGDADGAARLLARASRQGRSDLRLAGRDLRLDVDESGAADWLARHVAIAGGRQAVGRDWRQFRGTPPRTGVVAATRPLLVPRYRVPLVRHPEEARRLERTRAAAAAAGDPLLPAGTPIAVGDRLVVQTPLGILAVDFESGRRVWLGAADGVTAAEADEAPAAGRPPRAFLDATSGNLASDGRLVFAVESRPEALLAARPGVTGFARLPMNASGSWTEGNTLSAYEVASGNVRWRLDGRPGPAEAPSDDEEAENPPSSGGRWHMGPPLVVGDDVFVLVEERGEVRVEARAAADGGLSWSQPLATYDDDETITSSEAAARRLAGLTPAFADGVLVCPIGGGCVVALDVATRSLLWAHAYPRPDAARQRGGFRLGRDDEGDEPAWAGEPAPLISDGRVILAPFDTRLVICLGLRDGQPLWQQPRAGRLTIAGVVDGRLLVSHAGGVEALELATGQRLWQRALGEGVRPSGRGILTPRSLLLPCDAPAVVEIAVADGSVVGRSMARDGGIPGNLVAHRGEVISRGIDSLDVFHQQDALEGRIETARAGAPDDPWAAYWSGQAAIAAGDVRTGLADLARAAGADGFRIPPGDLSLAVVAAMRLDFPTAAHLWAEFPRRLSAEPPPEIDRMLVDGFLARQEPAAAWPSLRRLLAALPEPGSDPEPLQRDPTDAHLEIAADRWLRSRLGRLAAAADESLRNEIDEACAGLVRAAAATPPAGGRRRQLQAVWHRLGPHPAAGDARRLLLVEAADPDAAAAFVGAEFLMRLDIEQPTAADQSASQGRIEADDAGSDTAWPLGRVERRDIRRDRVGDRLETPPQLRPVPIASGRQPRAAHAAIDVARQRVVLSDRLGRPLAEPLPVPGLAGGFGFQFVPAVELAATDRLVFVRSAAGLTAHDVGGDRQGVPLWTVAELGIAAGEETGRWALGGRVTRDGAVPLGMRIREPDERTRSADRGMLALPGGLMVPGQRSITLLDPGTGRVLWKRDQLPAGLDWCADGEFLCGLTAGGSGSLVLAAADGRVVHSFEAPHRRQRLATRGRRFVTVQPLDDAAEQPIARRVRLDLVDPADRETRPLGSFDGKARATETGDGRLAVLEPEGRLTVLDLTDGSLVFRCDLPRSPQPIGRLAILPWQDRYLVVAGASDLGEPEGADVSPLEPLMLSGGAAAPLSGAVWALDRADGRTLWPGPAVIERHCLHTAQPADLPVLVFCRILEPQGSAAPVLSVLCLDKRTGHAVLEDDRIPLEGPAAGSCELAADPETHTVTIRDAGSGGGRLVLTFTGQPTAPQTPFQSRGRPPSLTAGLDLLDARLGRAPGERLEVGEAEEPEGE